MTNHAAAPTLRAAVFAVVCTLLAVGAHLPMTPARVPSAVVALGALAVFGVARAAASVERGLAAIAGLVGACQFGLHFLFELVQRPMAAAPTVSAPRVTVPVGSMGSMADMPSMAQDPLAALSMGPMPPVPASGMSPSPLVAAVPHIAAGGAPMGLSLGMTFAHVLAALVAAWWLRRGEAAVFATARWAAVLVRASWRTLAWLLATPTLPVRTRAPRAPRFTDTASALRSRLIRFVVIGRGPPVRAAR